jgi:hypothetical protein
MRSIISLLLWLVTAQVSYAEKFDLPAMQRLYRDGVLPNGGPLQGEREAGLQSQGAAAACVNCHRRSGLGTAEGQVIIPPITAKYLFRPRGRHPEDMDFRFGQSVSSNRMPYTDATLIRAIREGRSADGRQLNFLMPHFDLDDSTVQSLVAYLKTLSADPAPGVSADTLHFATIVTPDADPIKRDAMLQVLDKFFMAKNEFLRGGARPMQALGSVDFRVTRRWQLHVWTLQGRPDTWERQLHDLQRKEPVFAAISGIGGDDWSPVHRFCEAESMPCIFPNVDSPVVAEQDFYSIYFSKGVTLEAELIAKQTASGNAPARLLQIYRAGSSGAVASEALRRVIAGRAVAEQSIAIHAEDAGKELAQALGKVHSGDTLVLWLQPEDLQQLPASTPPATQVFVSGLLGGMEAMPLPPAWRNVAKLTYPVDLPDRRKFRMNFPMGWFKVQHLPMVAERTQSDTYLACGILAEDLSEMQDTFVRDYLLERIEVMLSHRVLTAFYPRLGLAPGQRFASKGGYIVHLARSTGTEIAADTEWLVP